MVFEDYLRCSAYQGQTAHPSEAGFAAFYHDASQRYFFALLDADGHVLLKSEGYPQVAARENGIQSVIKNRPNKDFFSVKEENGKYYLSLRAANNREIARSCNMESEADALDLILYASGEKIRSGSGTTTSTGRAQSSVTTPVTEATATVETAAPVAAMTTATTTSATVVEPPVEKEDDYLPCREYEGRHVNDKMNNVALFKHQNGQFYFALYNADGSVRLRSEGFGNAAKRDSELSGVLRNLNNTAMYSTIRRGAYFMTVLKDKTGREVGRSCLQKDEAATATAEVVTTSAAPTTATEVVTTTAAETITEAVTATTAAAETTTEAVIITTTAGTTTTDSVTTAAAPQAEEEDDYLPCRVYQGHAVTDEANNVALFTHSDGQFYFAVYNDDGSVRLRSEGFGSVDGRDSELAGALKHLNNPDMYSTIAKGAYYMTVLRDETGREVGRSCLLKNESAAPVVTTTVTTAATTPVIIEAAAGKTTVTKSATTWVASEAATAATVIAAPTVVRTLIDTTTSVREAAPVVIEEAAVVVPEVAPVVEETVIAPPPPVVEKEKEDDYLVCGQYEGHEVTDKANNVALFQHANGQHYFAIYNADGSVHVRSEGFRSTADRDSELEGALSHLNDASMYSTIRRGIYYISVLKDKTGREVGRSCMHTDEPKVVTPVAPVVATVAAAAAAFAAPTVETVVAPEVTPPVTPPPPAPVAEVDVEDDYLPCRIYEGRHVNDKANNVALFKHEDGQFYFAVYNKDGSVRLRSEGFKTSRDRDSELSGVMKNLNNPDMYSTIRRGEYFITVLKDKTGREVGRSCLQKDAPKVVAAAPVVTPVTPVVTSVAAAVAAAAAAAAATPSPMTTPKAAPVVKAAAPIVETTAAVEEAVSSGFDWKWWLLLPLLLLAAWWLFGKGCNTETPAPSATIPKATTAVPVDTAKTAVAVPAAPTTAAAADAPVTKSAAVTKSCPACESGTDPIFTSVCSNPKKLDRLGSNPEFGNSHDLSPAQFYVKLKKAYADNEVDKVFLDRIYKAMGYSGFADAKAEQFSAVVLPVGSTGRLGYSKAHKTGCYTLPDAEYHRKAFHIDAMNGCDLHFMKTCGNHFFNTPCK